MMRGLMRGNEVDEKKNSDEGIILIPLRYFYLWLTVVDEYGC